MQSKHSPAEIEELLQKPGAKLFVACSRCGENFLSPKRELNKLSAVSVEECKDIPVVGSMVKDYLEDPAIRDNIVGSKRCGLHWTHYTCFVKFARKFRVPNLHKNPDSEQHFKCPDSKCEKQHDHLAQWRVHMRREFYVKSYQAMEVQIMGKFFSIFNSLVLCASG